MGNVYNLLQLEFGINGCEGRNKKSRVVVVGLWYHWQLPYWP